MSENKSPLSVTVSISRKANLGKYESGDVFVSVSGVTAETTAAEVSALLSGPGALAYDAARLEIERRIADMREPKHEPSLIPTKPATTAEMFRERAAKCGWKGRTLVKGVNAIRNALNMPEVVTEVQVKDDDWGPMYIELANRYDEDGRKRANWDAQVAANDRATRDMDNIVKEMAFAGPPPEPPAVEEEVQPPTIEDLAKAGDVTALIRLCDEAGKARGIQIVKVHAGEVWLVNKAILAPLKSAVAVRLSGLLPEAMKVVAEKVIAMRGEA